MVSGVFDYLINKDAFLDKLTLGIHGKLRKRMPKSIVKKANLPIGGPGRPYARSLHGIHLDTGNPFELKYGPNRTYRNLFDAKFTVRSERIPLSWQEVEETIKCLFRKGVRTSLNSVELTWDVSVPFRYFENHIMAKTHSIRTLIDDHGRQTMYAGSPGAKWMLRIYQKTKKTTRVEFVLRRSFLTKAGINDLAGLGALRDVPLNRLVRFPAVCGRALEDLVIGKVSRKRSQLIIEWQDRRPIGMLLDLLQDYGLPGDQILRTSAVEEMLLKMQKSFTWAYETVEASKE
jgi:hypothetical protein